MLLAHRNSNFSIFSVGIQHSSNGKEVYVSPHYDTSCLSNELRMQDSFSDKQRTVDAAIGQIERAFAWIYYDAT
ncbi:hypothetical protein AB9K21_01690 [Anaplasma phagocytophilum]|uniref:hypothetical protein n=1 Tax=Anaplasma phagocytophilum TaxID=948 RepID=UPI0005F8F4D4|nr:hypothetical protein ANAPH2_00255 [Anaplasma phagocytophilum]